MTFQSSEYSGFTLLEVVVAMTLLATIGMATFGWINSSLESLYRVEQHSLKYRGSRAALAVLSSLNPMEHPTGEKQVGIFSIRWEGHLVEPVQQGVNSLGRASLYELGLYDVAVTVMSGDQPIADFSVKQVGYFQVREFTLAQ